MPRALLIANLLILTTNFIVAMTASETSNAVMRTTGRAVGSVPTVRFDAVALRTAAAPVGASANRAHDSEPISPRAGPVVVRLAKYLDRMGAADQLTEEQMATLYREVVRCAVELRGAAAQWEKNAPDGARARVLFGALRQRLGRETAMALRGAALHEGDLMQRLVRVVIASAG